MSVPRLPSLEELARLARRESDPNTEPAAPPPLGDADAPPEDDES